MNMRLNSYANIIVFLFSCLSSSLLAGVRETERKTESTPSRLEELIARTFKEEKEAAQRKRRQQELKDAEDAKEQMKLVTPYVYEVLHDLLSKILTMLRDGTYTNIEVKKGLLRGKKFKHFYCFLICNRGSREALVKEHQLNAPNRQGTQQHIFSIVLDHNCRPSNSSDKTCIESELLNIEEIQRRDKLITKVYPLTDHRKKLIRIRCNSNGNGVNLAKNFQLRADIAVENFSKGLKKHNIPIDITIEKDPHNNPYNKWYVFEVNIQLDEDGQWIYSEDIDGMKIRLDEMKNQLDESLKENPEDNQNMDKNPENNQNRSKTKKDTSSCAIL